MKKHGELEAGVICGKSGDECRIRPRGESKGHAIVSATAATKKQEGRGFAGGAANMFSSGESAADPKMRGHVA